MTSILVVEDDPSIRLGLEDTLRGKGFDVEAVTRGDVGLQRALDTLPDLVVLDIMLPDMDGFEVCRRLKSHKAPVCDIPVIMLSARGAELDRVRGLELGADDYITKPFSLMEFLARVSAVLRRSGRGQGESLHELRFGDVSIDFRTHRVQKAGKSIELGARSLALLRALATRAGEAVSREELVNLAWGYEQFPNTRTVDNHLLKLRKALEDKPSQPRYLQTVHGAGYRFVADERD